MNQNNLLSYAMDFASFIIQNTKNLDKIKSIILFGSVARLDSEKNSDIDIFIDTTTEIISEEIEAIKTLFLKSSKYQRYWKLLSIDNELSIKIGDLEKWDLKRSIISDGILLYGKYSGQIKTKEYTLFILKTKGKRKDKVKMWRLIYGYSQKVNGRKYHTKGLIEQYNGKKLSSAIFVVPMTFAVHMKIGRAHV